MPTKTPAPLPQPLRYLQAFANALAKLPVEELNEDVDASRLEVALRKRIRGMSEEAAEAALASDLDLLEQWLKDKPDHPAHWIRGYLLSPDLAMHLTRPAQPPPRGPEMAFEAPTGWKVKAVPFRLDLKAGNVLGSIMAIDEFTFELLQVQREQAAKTHSPSAQGTSETTAISFDQCSGRKYVYCMAAPAPWKRVDYVLRVPGGFVAVGLGTLTGADFDESPLESKLHTLRISASG